jgi:hypothetical protein
VAVAVEMSQQLLEVVVQEWSCSVIRQITQSQSALV